MISSLLPGPVPASPPLQDAAVILKKESGLEVDISTGSGSDGAIDGLGQGQIDVGLYAGELLGSVKARYPQVIFTPAFIGRQVVVFAVSGDVWDGGVHSLTNEQIRKIYQKRITNWKELGGPIARFPSLTGIATTACGK
ncbi:MAG: substrate-binding domain-containing protein [Chthoniobacteraceae bacterium]